MDTNLPITPSLFEETNCFLRWLDDIQFGVVAAYWDYYDEYEDWRLCLVTDKYPNRMVLPFDIFVKLNNHFKEGGYKFLDTKYLRMASSTNRMVQDLVARVRRAPSLLPTESAPTHFGPTIIGDRIIENMYLVYVSPELFEGVNKVSKV